MKFRFALIAALILAAPALRAQKVAEEEPESVPAEQKAAPAEEKAAPAEKAPEAAQAPPKAQPKAAEAAPEAPAKPEAAPQPAKKEAPAAADKEEKREEKLEAEWRFLKESSDDAGPGVTEAAIDDLHVFVQQHPESPMKPEALFLLASLRQKKGDYKPALVDLLRLLYEYPGSKMSLQAKSAFLDLSDKKLARRLKPAAGDLVKTPESEDKSQRLALLVEKLSGGMEDSLYDPTVEEIRRFQLRFPDYPESDKIQWSLARLHEKASRHAAALLAHRKLLAVYPQSPFRPQAQFAIANLYAESLKDYKKAIEAYQELVEKYPQASEVLPSLERTAQLFSDKLGQYELAVEIDEKIVKLFPKTDGALKALQMEAKLQRDRLNGPAEAIKTWLRLAGMFGYPAALEAFQNAAKIARRDLKDYGREAELRRKFASDFPNVKEAAPELFAAAEIYEDDLKDGAKAAEAYKEVAAKFPGTKLAGKAQDRVAKLEKQ